MNPDIFPFSLTTYSPSGRLLQIDYIIQSMQEKIPSVGIKTSNSVVLVTAKKCNPVLCDVTTVKKINVVADHLGMTYTGMATDYRALLTRARKITGEYRLTYRAPISTEELASSLGSVLQEYTQNAGVRPFGVSLLICGWDDGAPRLFSLGPAGANKAMKAITVGKNSENGMQLLEKHYREDLDLDGAIRTAIMTLKEGFDGDITSNLLEIGVCSNRGFRTLTSREVDDHLEQYL